MRRNSRSPGPGCKAVICQRLKQSGMHWSEAGARAIITYVASKPAAPEDQTWHQARNQTGAA